MPIDCDLSVYSVTSRSVAADGQISAQSAPYFYAYSPLFVENNGGSNRAAGGKRLLSGECDQGKGNDREDVAL